MTELHGGRWFEFKTGQTDESLFYYWKDTVIIRFNNLNRLQTQQQSAGASEAVCSSYVTDISQLCFYRITLNTRRSVRQPAEEVNLSLLLFSYLQKPELKFTFSCWARNLYSWFSWACWKLQFWWFLCVYPMCFCGACSSSLLWWYRTADSGLISDGRKNAISLENHRPQS